MRICTTGHRTLTAATLALTLGAVACDSPTVPPRLIPYQFAFQGFTEPLVYRWPDGHVIRVHVLPSEDPELRTVLDGAFEHTARAWNDAVLYGEYRIERADLESADVIIAWANQSLPLETDVCPPLPFGSAWTTFCLDPDDSLRIDWYALTSGEHVEDGVHMIVQLLADQTDPARIAGLLAHEFGHVLGIGAHPCRVNQVGCDRRAGAFQSIMFSGVPDRTTPSAADRATIEVLYHTRPHVTP